MSLYKEFSTLLPYIQSVRKLKNFLSFDIAFPNTWKLPKKFVQEDKVLEQDSTVANHRVFSFVSEIVEDEVEKTSQNIRSIIKYNLDLEEKQKLFQSKVEELKSIFEKQNLSNLKSLEFEIKKTKLQLEDGEEQLETPRLVPEGTDEGQD